ncbi:MAG: DUF2778 domain-containing protein [Hyphomicrobiales bacterium]|nr:DUF2778 domain-containing protein [Hyphomicrobiales bacterium]
MAQLDAAPAQSEPPQAETPQPIARPLDLSPVRPLRAAGLANKPAESDVKAPKPLEAEPAFTPAPPPRPVEATKSEAPKPVEAVAPRPEPKIAEARPEPKVERKVEPVAPPKIEPRPAQVAVAAPARSQAPISMQSPEGANAMANPQPIIEAPRRMTRAQMRREQRRMTRIARTQRPENRSFFDRLFGGDQPGPADNQRLAYAAPQTGGLFSGFGRASTPDNYTAIYDISARTVYLPDGTRLEAHSGLGQYMDDPDSRRLRMRGVTPPHLYNLTYRERLFHGVRALRLTPVGGAGAIHGRAGLLAHTYMLGPSGQSNGCVSFRDYRAFLRAFENGQIRRLQVVASR